MPTGVYERKPFTEEHRRTLSEAQIRRYQDSKERKKTSEAVKEAYARPEVKKKKSETMIGNTNRLGTNPEYPNGFPTYWRVESRKVWQKTHGRSIPSWGLIHHWDWDYENLNPENLGLLKTSHHRKIHYRNIKGGSLKELIPLLQENKIIGE